MIKRAVVAGAMAQRPGYAGHTWQFIEYVLGLKRLGWDVLFVDWLEQEHCYDEQSQPCALEDSYNLRYFRRVMSRFGLDDSFSLICNGGSVFVGRSREDLLSHTRNSAFLLNVMGFLTDESILTAAPLRVFLDTDPGIGQIWRELGLHDLFVQHDRYVSIGENIGTTACEIPTCGIDWITMRQPVVLEMWPVVEQHNDRITSVVSWRGPFGPLEYRGRKYGMRVHEFRKFVELPAMTGDAFELAIDIDPAEVKDLEMLKINNWRLLDPKEVAADVDGYRRFIQRSKAELMVAKNIYVETKSGWFSDRSTCYLASGKPVIAQDTGLDSIYPTGAGLLTFKDAGEAAAAVEELNRDYRRHARAAREIAEAYFDSDKVFNGLLSKLGVG